MAGNLTLNQCHDLFNNPSRRASSNYAIDNQGEIAQYVLDDNTSWCSSSTANDRRAITIEVANCDAGPEWKISDKANDALIQLCASICEYYKIGALRWKNDQNALTKAGYQNMTIHRWFKNKVCPGPYLEKNMGIIARDVNEILGIKPSALTWLYYSMYVLPKEGSAVTPEHILDELKVDAQFKDPKIYEEWGKKVVVVGKYKTVSTFNKFKKRALAACPEIACFNRLWVEKR